MKKCSAVFLSVVFLSCFNSCAMERPMMFCSEEEQKEVVKNYSPEVQENIRKFFLDYDTKKVSKKQSSIPIMGTLAASHVTSDGGFYVYLHFRSGEKYERIIYPDDTILYTEVANTEVGRAALACHRQYCRLSGNKLSLSRDS